MKRKFFAITLFAAGVTTFALITFGQTRNQSSSPTPPARVGSITGRIVNESGKPMPNARVFVSGAGRQPVRRMINTDEAGRFVVDDLPRGTYSISAQANGYVLVRQPGDTIHHRPGDSVSLVLKKGAAITGTVTNSDGDPVVGVPISAVLVRDEQGRRSSSTFGLARYTDDRGVYRLFGLPGGTYIIAAGPRGIVSSSILNAYGDDSPTYYPSSTRDTAAEVSAAFGSEVSGIDIRYRGERGRAVSGTVIDQSLPDSLAAGGSVLLMRASSDTLEAQTAIQPRTGESVFALYGVPDGDYYLMSRRGPYQSDDGATSKRVPVKVRGRDITGITINLEPSGSIAGRLTLDLATKDLKCETQPPPAVEEILMGVSDDDSDSSDPSRFASVLQTPDSKGDFVFQGLPAGRYRIDSRLLLDEAWYLRSMTVPGPTNTPVDTSSTGIVVKPGRRINGVRLVLGDGAASIRGRVVTEKGAALPDRLRAQLVPAEANAGDETLRFVEAEVQSDGAFKLLNVAPGRYWILVRRLPEDSRPRMPRPQAWNSAARAALRREAAVSNVAIELKPCQRIADYQLRYAPPKDAPTTQPKLK